MQKIGIEFILIIAGIILLFVGDKLANVGNSVDSIVSSKWTAIALIVAGGGLFLASKYR